MWLNDAAFLLALLLIVWLWPAVIRLRADRAKDPAYNRHHLWPQLEYTLEGGFIFALLVEPALLTAQIHGNPTLALTCFTTSFAAGLIFEGASLALAFRQRRGQFVGALLVVVCGVIGLAIGLSGNPFKPTL